MKYIFYGGILLILMSIAGLALGDKLSPATFLGLAFVAYPLIAPKLSVRNALKGATHVSEAGIYEFEESKFSIMRPSVQVAMPWTSVHSVLELKEQFAIFSNKTCFHAVPKRFFSPDQLAPFRTLLQQALANNGKVLEVN